MSQINFFLYFFIITSFFFLIIDSLFFLKSAVVVNYIDWKEYQKNFKKKKEFSMFEQLVSHRFLINVKLHKLLNIPPGNDGRVVYIDWKRGSKRGQTRATVIAQNQITWLTEEIGLPSTIFFNAKTKKFNKKVLEMKIMMVFFSHKLFHPL